MIPCIPNTIVALHPAGENLRGGATDIGILATGSQSFQQQPILANKITGALARTSTRKIIPCYESCGPSKTDWMPMHEATYALVTPLKSQALAAKHCNSIHVQFPTIDLGGDLKFYD